MQWNSVGEFFAMGGYAFYVWGSFGVTALALVIEPLLLKKRQRDVIDSLQRERKADERQGTTA
ncbi:MAG: heme exporter protein CcmD [Rhodocyclaceae bacterium]|nr:MAG: heme exporter protein CcmD [Rhodocyclaceae bacterium]